MHLEEHTGGRKLVEVPLILLSTQMTSLARKGFRPAFLFSDICKLVSKADKLNNWSDFPFYVVY